MTTTERHENENPKRASVWSVSEGWLTAYFALFTIQFTIGIALIIWYETDVVTRDSAIETLMNIFGRAGVIPILSASTSYIFAEGGRLTMVISNWVERKLEEREQKREQALIERIRAETEERVRAEMQEEVRAKIEEGIRAYRHEQAEGETNGGDLPSTNRR